VSALLPRQLSLPVALRDDATFESFCWPCGSADLQAALRQQCAPSGEALILLWSEAGYGRSHLLQAACHHAAPAPALYLPLASLAGASAVALFEALETLTLLCLDDLDAVLGNEQWDEALFHILNRARASGTRLLCSTRKPPSALSVGLADLRSRLAGGLVFALPALDDDGRLRLLQQGAQRRGLRLDAAAARYVLARAGRLPSQLHAVLDALDVASLHAQRALTVPFIRETLRW